MNDSTREAIVETSRASEKGTLHFGQVVAQLMDAGVESYAVDFRTHTATYYPPGDEAVSVDIASPEVEIAEEFDGAAIKDAILGAQKDEVRYRAGVQTPLLRGWLRRIYCMNR